MHFSRSPFIALAVTATIGRSLQLGDLADLAHRLDAVHLRHHDVHQHDVDVRLALQRSRSRRGRCRPRRSPCRAPPAPSTARRCCACRRRRSAPSCPASDLGRAGAGRPARWRCSSGSLRDVAVQERAPPGRAGAPSECTSRTPGDASRAAASASSSSSRPARAVDDDRQSARARVVARSRRSAPRASGPAVSGFTHDAVDAGRSRASRSAARAVAARDHLHVLRPSRYSRIVVQRALRRARPRSSVPLVRLDVAR